MKRGVITWFVFCLFACVAPSVALAEDPPPPAPPEAAPAQAPKTPAAPAAPPVASAAEVARLLDPDFLATLRVNFGAVPRGDSGVTGADKLCITSLPEGCEVYIASVSEIRESRTPDGVEAAVEDVVFTDAHFVGEAPLCKLLPAGDYVLAVRAYGKINGFDAVGKGACVSKTTTDIITGGLRHAYHLYPVRKREGEFQLLVVNFSRDESTLDPAARSPKGSGLFNLDLSTLAADLVTTTNVPEDQRAKVAAKLNEQGAAFYETDGTQYFVKLTLLGVSYRIEEWPVE